MRQLREACDGKGRQNPWETIQIPILSKDSPEMAVGVGPEELPLIKAVVSLINSSPFDPGVVFSLSGETLEREIRQVLVFIPSFPVASQEELLSPEERSRRGLSRSYQENLKNALAQLKNPGEIALKNTLLENPIGEESKKMKWENLVGIVNVVSRWFVTQRTGVNCLEQTEEGKLKPIELLTTKAA